MPDYCGTCDVNPAEVKGECDTCYRYRKRTGRKRPDATERQIRLNQNWVPPRIRALRNALKDLTSIG